MPNKASYIIQLKNQFSRGAKKIRAQMKGLGKDSDKAAKANKRLAKSFKGLKNTAKNALGGIAVAFGVREFIRRGAAFQDAIADLSSITGSAGKDLQFLTDESLRLAKASSIAQVDVARAFTQIASAKSELLKDPKGLSVVTEQALLLANAAGIEVPEAVRASVGALNQFNQGADQAARFVNVLAAGAKVGASQVGETAEALKNAGTVAALFKLTFEETNAILQVFAKNELKAAEAGTALRGTLSKLEKFAGGKLAPSKLGIIRSLEIIEKLGLTNTQVIKEFGEENLRSILILRQNIPLIKQWTQELTGTNIAQEQASKRLATFNAKMRRLGVSLNDKIIKVFLRLEPVLNKQIERMGKFFDTIQPDQVDALADSLVGAAEAIVTIGQGLGLIAKAFKSVGEGIGQGVARFETKGLVLGLVESAILARASLPSTFGLDPSGGLQKAEAGARGGTTPANLQRSQTDVNVNLNAPEKAVGSVKTTTSGKTPGLNVGVNLVTAG